MYVQYVQVISANIPCTYYVQPLNAQHKFFKFKDYLEAASERTNIPLSSARTWTPFHHPPQMHLHEELLITFLPIYPFKYLMLCKNIHRKIVISKIENIWEMLTWEALQKIALLFLRLDSNTDPITLNNSYLNNFKIFNKLIKKPAVKWMAALEKWKRATLIFDPLKVSWT